MKLIFILLAAMLIVAPVYGIGITTALNKTGTATPSLMWFVGNATYNQTYTLPDAATTGWKGWPITFIVAVDPGSNYFRLNATGGDDVAGNNYYATTDLGASLTAVSDGTDYEIIGTPKGTWVAHATSVG